MKEKARWRWRVLIKGMIVRYDVTSVPWWADNQKSCSPQWDSQFNFQKNSETVNGDQSTTKTFEPHNKSRFSGGVEQEFPREEKRLLVLNVESYEIVPWYSRCSREKTLTIHILCSLFWTSTLHWNLCFNAHTFFT